MQNETFQVGEIARFQNLPLPFNVFDGEECEVMTPCELTPIEDIQGAFGFALVHQVKFRGSVFAVKPFSLKKRRQKGDDSVGENETDFAKKMQEWFKEPVTV